MELKESVLIPEFTMYENRLDESELKELNNRLSQESRTSKDQFRLFTDILSEYVGSGEYRNQSDDFLAMCAKATYLRGMYGYTQIIARVCDNLGCKGYAAAAYCRQSLDPRWLNNLRNYVNQAWQSKDYITFAELAGELASVLIELGYVEHSREVASESIDKVTKATAKDWTVRTMVQAALLRARIILANISQRSEARQETFTRLDSAEDTARLLDHQLALADIKYYRASALVDSREYDQALGLVNSALRKYERMGYLQGVTNSRNLIGIISLNKGELQDARDQFEELLLIQQQLNNQIGLAKTLINVGEIDRELGQLDQMETYNKRALEISQEAEYMRGITTAKMNLGDVALRRGNLQEALDMYLESKELAERAGMRDLLILSFFLAGDASFILQNREESLEWYQKAKSVSLETSAPIQALQADVSNISTCWASNMHTSKEVLESMRTLFGTSNEWIQSNDASLMAKIRRKIFNDSSIQSNLCVLYDGEKNFECRADRTSLKKECFGNLFWLGSLCPFFKEFIEALDE